MRAAGGGAPAGENSKLRKAGREQALVQMVNKTDKHKHWLATRPTSLTTDMTQEQEAVRTRTLLAQRSWQRSSVRLGAERAGAISERRGSVRNFSAARWASRMYIVLHV
jgi:hypothetical protein